MTHYTDYATYLSRFFDGKVQKLTVNAGFTCPNRDGTKGRGGCTYCNNASFSPSVSTSQSVTQQLEAGKQFFERKYTSMRYLAYFQSYTNTYGDAGRLMSMYREALAVPGVVGLIIGTRPDMMPDDLLQQLSELAREHYVMIEFGAESCHDITLECVNRCHTWADTVDAVTRTHNAGLHTGVHLIMGLPGETREMMLETVRQVCNLPVDVLKFHQLQVLKGTRMALEADSISTFEVDEYLDLCIEIIGIVPPHIAIERFTSSAPARLLIAPRWGLKNYQFVDLLKARLKSATTLYVTDMDGTLLDNDSLVSNRSAHIISELSHRGALITVATARTQATVDPLLHSTFTRCPAIVMTGAAMWDRNKRQLIDPILFAPGVAADIASRFKAHGIDPFIYCVESLSHLNVYHGIEMNDGENEFYRQRRNLELKKFKLGHTPTTNELDSTILLFAIGDTDRVVKLSHELSVRTDCSVSCYPDIHNPQRSLIELFAPTVSKAAAVKRLASQTGASRIVVFGDNLNDLSMMSIANVAVAVGNAFPQVKEAADVVIGPNSADSVARYIEKDFNNS